jgi:hypothetical protein
MQGAQRGAALTPRLLAIRASPSLEPQPIDLARLVRRHERPVAPLDAARPPSVQMALDLPSALPAAQADANQIELALLNLR